MGWILDIADPGPLPQILPIFAAQGRRTKTREGIKHTRGIKRARLGMSVEAAEIFSVNPYLYGYLQRGKHIPKDTSRI